VKGPWAELVLFILVLGRCWSCCGVLVHYQRRGGLKHESPFRELRRRPAGEALRVKLAEYDEKFTNRLLVLVCFLVLLYVLLSSLLKLAISSRFSLSCWRRSEQAFLGFLIHRLLREYQDNGWVLMGSGLWRKN